MKRTIFVMLMGVTLAMTTGCIHRQLRGNGCEGGNCTQAEGYADGEACPTEGACPGEDGCRRCGLFGGLCGLHRHRGDGNGENANAGGGPQGGAVAYPYYNLRGPRDFLVRNPQSIGP
jgi:hypothetical protein